MRRTLLAFVFIQLIVLLGYACTKDVADAPNLPPADGDTTAANFCDNNVISYSADIEPIMSANCSFSGCHNSTGTSNSGYSLETYAGVNAAQANSTFWCAISHGSGCVPMPSGSPKLADNLLQKIDCWIQQGAPNN